MWYLYVTSSKSERKRKSVEEKQRLSITSLLTAAVYFFFVTEFMQYVNAFGMHVFYKAYRTGIFQSTASGELFAI